jgi:hypothetical protein
MENALLALALLACPAGMGLMMWWMNRGMKHGPAKTPTDGSGEDLRAEHARVSADIERLEREQRRHPEVLR